MNKINKETDKFLKDLASKLPTHGSIGMVVRGQKLIENKIKVKGVRNINPKQRYIASIGDDKPQAVNHYKRMRSAFIQNGNEGINEYLKPYIKTENKQ